MTSITVERSKWIDKLRSNVASYSGELLTYGVKCSLSKQADKSRRRSFGPKPDAPTDLTDRFQRIEELSSVIQLQLNPGNAPVAAARAMAAVRRNTWA